MNTNKEMSVDVSGWDKIFPPSDKVEHKKVSFKNRYGITLVGDLYIPKNSNGQKLAALAVCGGFGAVKEQASGFYAQTMAERGFVDQISACLLPACWGKHCPGSCEQR